MALGTITISGTFNSGSGTNPNPNILFYDSATQFDSAHFIGIVQSYRDVYINNTTGNFYYTVAIDPSITTITAFVAANTTVTNFSATVTNSAGGTSSFQSNGSQNNQYQGGIK